MTTTAAKTTTKKRGSRELQCLASTLHEPSSKRVRDEMIYALSADALNQILKEATGTSDRLAARTAAARVQALVKEGVISEATLSKAAASKDSKSSTVSTSVARKVDVNGIPKKQGGSKAAGETSLTSVLKSVGGFFTSVFRFGGK